jgi:hypothetical protein
MLNGIESASPAIHVSEWRESHSFTGNEAPDLSENDVELNHAEVSRLPTAIHPVDQSDPT